MRKTILELDMVGYSSVARMLEQSLGPAAVFNLNQSVQTLVHRGLAETKLDSPDTVLLTTGDGAILAFDYAEQAHRFAEAFHATAREYNEAKTEVSAKRVFRTGAATGEIYLQRLGTGGFDFSGITIADAVRLEAQAKPGELLIDNNTFSNLPPFMQSLYHGEEEVRGKRNEVYKAHRYTIDPGAPQQLGPVKDEYVSKPISGEENEFEDGFGRLDFLDQMERLCNAAGAIIRLMQAMSIPMAQRPPDTLNCVQQCSIIFDWAEVRNKICELKQFVQRLLIKFGLSEGV
jgi:class 3 adenylate cyclase